jgi:hypothetical protein
MHLRLALLAPLIALSTVVLVRFDIAPAPIEQAERITISSLATRVAQLEDMNLDLAARVDELERVVDTVVAASAIAETPLPTATPTGTGRFGPLQTPAAPTETATPTATPMPRASPTPINGDIDINGITVAWGPLLDLFSIYNVRIETRKFHLETGGTLEAQVLAFEARVNYTFFLAVLQADMLDAEGFPVTLPSLIEFSPDYNATGWERDVWTSALIILPKDLERVATIRIERINISGF